MRSDPPPVSLPPDKNTYSHGEHRGQTPGEDTGARGEDTGAQGKIRDHGGKYGSTGENTGERGKYLLLGKGTFMTPVVEPYVTGFEQEFERLNFVDIHTDYDTQL